MTIKKIFISLCIVISFSVYTANAAWNDYLPQPLMRGDLDNMKRIAREDLVNAKIGTEIRWDNKETGLSGQVKLIRRFEIRKFKCHEVQHLVNFKADEVVMFSATLCKNPEGKVEMLPFVFPNM